MEVVISESDRTQAVTIAANRHYSRCWCCENLVQYKVGEQKVAEMIGSKLRLESIYCNCVVNSHDTGIVDQHINVRDVSPAVQRGSSLANCGKR